MESSNSLDSRFIDCLRAFAANAAEKVIEERCQNDPQLIEQVHDFNARFFAAITGNHAAEF